MRIRVPRIYQYHEFYSRILDSGASILDAQAIAWAEKSLV